MRPDLGFATIETLSAEVRASRLSPVALMESLLERIARIDPVLQSFICLAPEPLEQARRAEQEIRTGTWRGPLHGIPVGIKDNYLTADMPTTAGSTAPGVAFPRTDSAVAARLRAAGAILVGKTRTHEFAWGTITPPTRNPWDTERIPGGSSGGSGAAVAAGLCPAAMGSDTGGSIRIPASLCGTVGLKPSFGRISRAGIVPHSWSLDHAGPLTRSVADAAILLQVLAGYDPADPGSRDHAVPDYGAVLHQGVRGLRVAVVRNHFFGRNHASVEAAVEQAIAWYARAGAVVHDVQLPNLQYGLGAIFAIELSSSTAYHDVSLRAGRVAHYTQDVRTLVQLGRFVTGPDLLKAEQLRTVLMQEFRRVFDKADVILGPTEPVTAPRIGQAKVEIAGGEESALAATWRLTYPYNLTGLPAITLPCGFDEAGLPIGLQIAAKPFDEATVLRAAHAYEAAHDWKDRHPNDAA
ncbi:MAG: Asp-tRNA(Asn)/Glu-tRNA(Gln) amidotransferase subunit GatA [Acidisphaera sp.]|nr:Asp-tRNA(Asn)/Glu-tRNA(Gln) amidotransferase subunit GatA [Acidisphaera sp.]